MNGRGERCHHVGMTLRAARTLCELLRCPLLRMETRSLTERHDDREHDDRERIKRYRTGGRPPKVTPHEASRRHGFPATAFLDL